MTTTSPEKTGVDTVAPIEATVADAIDTLVAKAQVALKEYGRFNQDDVNLFVKKASALTNKELGALPGDVARIAGGTSTRPSRAGNPAAHTHSPSSQNS